MTLYPSRVDEQLCPHPGADALQTTHPGWQGAQTSAERRRVPEDTLNLRPQLIERLTIFMLHQIDAVQPVRALVVLATTRMLRLAKRGQQLVALRSGPIVQIARIVFTIGQQVTTAMQLPDQAVSDLLLADVQGRDLPGLRQGVQRPNRVQFIAFGPASGSPSPPGIGVFAVIADRQRLAVQKGHQGRRSAAAQALLDCTPTKAGTDRINAAANGSLRRDRTRPQGRRTPMRRVASPADWPIMDSGPEHGGDDHPGRQLHILLSDLPGDLLQGVVQYGPEFAFHGTAPSWRFGQETPAEVMPKTRTPSVSTPSNIFERCCPAWERDCNRARHSCGRLDLEGLEPFTSGQATGIDLTMAWPGCLWRR